MKLKKLLVLVVALLILFLSEENTALAKQLQKPNKDSLDRALSRTVNYLKNQMGQNDWDAIALVCSGEELPANFISKLEEKARDPGQLTTDLARLILAVVAAGGDPGDFAGKNLVQMLQSAQLKNGKFADNLTGQGGELINAHIWAVLALIAAGARVLEQEKALDWLLKQQQANGGFSYREGELEADPDMTGMALMAMGALGFKADDAPVKKALNYLSNIQLSDGGFASWGVENAESCAVVLEGLISVGIDPGESRWTKGGGNPVTALLSFQLPDGSFAHLKGGKSNRMATQQALLALAVLRNGLPTWKMLQKQGGIAFKDLPASYWAYNSVIKLVEESVIKGYPDRTFRPEATLTRAEFAVCIIRKLGLKTLPEAKISRFVDLPPAHWANSAVKIAIDRGLLKGVSSSRFAPDAPVTGAQVMAVLIRLAGLDEEAENMPGKPWYSNIIKIAMKKGFLYPEFSPEKPATRAQCAWSLAKI